MQTLTENCQDTKDELTYQLEAIRSDLQDL